MVDINKQAGDLAQRLSAHLRWCGLFPFTQMGTQHRVAYNIMLTWLLTFVNTLCHKIISARPQRDSNPRPTRTPHGCSVHLSYGGVHPLYHSYAIVGTHWLIENGAVNIPFIVANR